MELEKMWREKIGLFHFEYRRIPFFSVSVECCEVEFSQLPLTENTYKEGNGSDCT